MKQDLKKHLNEFKDSIERHACAFIDMTALNLLSLHQGDHNKDNFVNQQSYFIQALNEFLFDLANDRDLENTVNHFCGSVSGDITDTLDTLADWNDQLFTMLLNARQYLEQNTELNDSLKKIRLNRMEEAARETQELMRALRAHYILNRKPVLN